MRSYDKYLRENRLPHIWCPGCGNGIVMKAIVKAVENKNLDQKEVVKVISTIQNWIDQGISFELLYNLNMEIKAKDIDF